MGIGIGFVDWAAAAAGPQIEGAVPGGRRLPFGRWDESPALDAAGSAAPARPRQGQESDGRR